MAVELPFYIKNNSLILKKNDLTLDLENLELICVEITKIHCRPFLLSV